MSDFIFSSSPTTRGRLSRMLQSIYHMDPPEVKEFHGSWGSLAASRNQYQGFAPLENGNHICIVSGGPVLTSSDNDFLTGPDDTAGTRYILDEWLNNNGCLSWDADLSGPFLVLILNKQTGDLRIVTDLMSFIPLYEGNYQNVRTIGTHIDVVAKAGNFVEQKDLASVADFILHGIVTYPWTFYLQTRQLAPASVHQWHLPVNNDPVSRHYWQPLEENHWQTINQAAEALREGLAGYILAVTRSMNRIATFLSGGEDSRTVLALLPKGLQRDAYIFLNEENRESRIAKKVAKIHGAKFLPAYRRPTRYLDVLPACSDLVGSGSQYVSAHTYGFHKSCRLSQYPAVLGGFLSDTLLKGYHIYKLLYRKGGQPLFTHKDPIDSPLFTDSMLSELNRRRSNHFAMVQNIRPRSVHEWFSMWPISMHSDISNLHSNRRLFRSYEPFMANTVVKLAAAVPQDWKRNRLLFHRMASPLFEPTKQIPHPNGWMPFHQGWQPYSPWYDTCFTRPLVKAWRRNQKRKGRYQGTWCDWNTVMQSEAWKKTIEQYTAANNTLDRIFTTDVKQLLERSDSGLHTLQKVNLLQALLSFIKRH